MQKWMAVGIVGLLLIGTIAFLYKQNQRLTEKLAEVRVANAALETALEAKSAELEINRSEMKSIEVSNAALDTRYQEAVNEINELRLTISRQAFERPYEFGNDIHSWLAGWMRNVQSATSPDQRDANNRGPTGTGSNREPAD